MLVGNKTANNIKNVENIAESILGALSVVKFPMAGAAYGFFPAAKLGIAKCCQLDTSDDEVVRQLDQCMDETKNTFLNGNYAPSHKKIIEVTWLNLAYDLAQKQDFADYVNHMFTSATAETTNEALYVSEIDVELTVREFAACLVRTMAGDDYNLLHKVMIANTVLNHDEQLNEQRQQLHEHQQQLAVQQEQLNQQHNVIEQIRGKEAAEDAYARNTLYKTEEFKERWDRPMFLDEYATEKVVTLRTLYGDLNDFLFPDYELDADSSPVHGNVKGILTSKRLLGKGIVIVGPPGIGKSTLISWLCNHEKNRKVFAYSFAEIFLENAGSPSSKITSDLSYVLERTDLTLNDLKGQILVLDGLDEIIHIISDSNLYVLIKNYFAALKNTDCSLIITCRTNYIPDLKKLSRAGIPYINLLPWKNNKIASFIDKYYRTSGKIISKESREKLISREYQNLYGIPLFLYMVLALKLDVGKCETVVDVYDLVFDEKSGIFHHSINDLPYEETDAKVASACIHESLNLSRKMAFDMFEKGEEVLLNPSYSELEQTINRDYFKEIHHTEGEESVQFIHRTMYEYFAVDYFVASIREKEIWDTIPEITCFIKRGKIDNTMADYLKIKFAKLYKKQDPDQKKETYLQWESNMRTIITKGICYCNKEIDCANVHEERQVYKTALYNIGRILNSIRGACNYQRYIFSSWTGPTRVCLQNEIKASGGELYCRNFDLSHMTFDQCFLVDADFKEAKFYNTGFNDSQLSSVNFSGAKMEDVTFVHATVNNSQFLNTVFKSVSMCNANLENVDFDFSAGFETIDLTEALLLKVQVPGPDPSEYSNLKNAIFSEISSLTDLCAPSADTFSREELLKKMEARERRNAEDVHGI